MLAKRIIPCLDVAGGRVVKGVQFQQLRDAGDPVERAALYERQGADEIVFLDIAASLEDRDTLVDLVRRTSEAVFIPFTVGGGIRTIDDIGRVLKAGADKVSINTAAIENPQLIAAGSMAFGSQCIVVAIDARRRGERWDVLSHAGQRPTVHDAVGWAHQVEQLGAGELLVTSIDSDGTQAGYDIELLNALSEAVRLPIIASGGAGAPADFLAAFERGHADAALAASIFHDGTYTVGDVKSYLRDNGVSVRPL